MSRPSPSTRFSLIPVLLLAASFACGIAAAHIFRIDLATAIATSALFGISAWLLRRSVVGTFLMLAAFAGAGAAAFTAEKEGVRPDRVKLLYDSGTISSGDPVEVEGVLTGMPEPSAEGHFLTLNTDRLRYRGVDRSVSGRVRLFVPRSTIDLPHLKHGSRIIASSALEREDEYLNPGVLRRPDLLDRLGIDASGSVKTPLLFEHVADESTILPLAWIYEQRAHLIADLTHELSPQAGGVMTASLLGDKHFLDRETAEVFREGGTFHVLVISGLHITFIGGILLLILRCFTRDRWVHFLASTTSLWAYTLAVGADVPVVRAAIMFTVVIFAYAIYRSGNLLNSLGSCALLLLAWRPSDLLDPSFQLTFVSVGSIVAIAYPLLDKLRTIGAWSPTAAAPFPPLINNRLKRICETLYWDDEAWQAERKRQIWSTNLFKAPYLSGKISGFRQKAFRYLVEGVLVSTVVQVCMLPLLVVYFHRVSVVSVVLNLWVGFFIAIESISAVAGVLLKNFSSILAAPFFMLAEVGNSLMLLLPRMLTGNSWSGLRLPVYAGPARLVYLLYPAALILIAWCLARWDPKGVFSQRRVLLPSLIVAAVLSVIIVFHPFSEPTPDGRLTIDFLDVGQGDAALITFPGGKTMLVDGGGRMRFRPAVDEETEPFEPDVRRLGESVVSEFLWERGYSRVDYILATHSDTDHMQGLVDVANNFSIGQALIGRVPSGDPDCEALLNILTRRGIPTSLVAQRDTWLIDDVSIEVLSPNAGGRDISSINDSSVVLKIRFGDRTFLLTGDIEAAAEADLVSGPPLSADVVKVPHHGSRTSSTSSFVEAVKPQIAVISVGRHSSFGHPHPEVVERWRSTGADVRTTGEKGMITVSTDGSDLKVSTFVP